MALTAHSEGENTSQLEKDLADALIEVGKQNMKIEGSSDDEKREKSMRNLAHPIAEAIESGSAIKVKGTATVAEINAKRDMAEGDIWAVSDTGVVTSPDGSTLNVTAGDLIRYDGAKWTQFLHLDLSGYVTTGQLNAAVATINAAIAAVSATLGSHADNKSNPHGVTAGQTGAYTKAETDAKIDDVSGGIAGHIADTSNPHSVTAGQVGAYTKTETDTKISEVGASISTHTADTSNPHSVTAEQVGAYTKEQVDGFIRNWSGYVVVPFGQEKPSASEAQLGKIYLVQVSNDPSVKDQYEEWISDGSAWSLIGTMSIDLSPYDKIVDAEAREKVINDALTAHKNDAVAHITAAERTSWNGAVSNSHTHSNKAELDKIASGDKSKWDGKQDAISDLATIRSGAAAGATAVQPSSLAKVATSGSYNDLSNKPTIPPAITIDSAMSSTSTNPVQNKVVNSALSGKLDFITDAAKITGTSQSFISWKIPVVYKTGVSGTFVRLWDVTSFKDGSIVDLSNDNVNFKGFFIAGKNQGFGNPEVVEIACKVSYNSTTHFLKSSSNSCGPCICSREEEGVIKYYLGIYYNSTLYSGQGASLCGFFSSYSSSENFSHKNFYGDYTPWENYPSKEPLWTKEWSWSGISDARSLFTARSLGVNLARTAASTFDGSANQLEIPIKGQLADANIASASTWNGYATGKQDKLTQGTNITISGNTISATDTTYAETSEDDVKAIVTGLN